METVVIAFGQNGTLSGQCTGCGKSFIVKKHSDSFEFDVAKTLFPKHEGNSIVLRHGKYCACGNLKIGYTFKDLSDKVSKNFVRISFVGSSVKLTVKRDIDSHSMRFDDDHVVQYFKDLIVDLLKNKKIE